MKKIIGWTIVLGILIGGFAIYKIAGAVSILQGYQGGTGFASTTVGNIGNCLKVNANSPMTWTIGTCGGGGGTPGGVNTQLQYNNSSAFGGAELFYNNSTFSFGANSTTPIATFVVQGTSTQPTLDIFRVASSSGATVFKITSQGLATFQPVATSTSALTVKDTSGNSVLSLDTSAGNSGVTIGTNTTSSLYNSAQLVIVGTSASTTLPFINVSSSSATSIFQVNANGNVGIGNIAPVDPLSVMAPAGVSDIAHFSSFIGAGNACIKFSNGGGGIDILRLCSGASTGESWLNSYAGLHFGTNNSSFGSTENMTILTNGNVGIGTTTPVQLLDVSSANSTFIVVNGGNGSDHGVQYVSNSVSPDWFTGTLATSRDFIIRNDSNATVPVTVLLANGNVGIGATKPNTTLEVYGTSSSTNASVTTNLTLKNVTNTFLATDPTGLVVSTTSPLSVAIAATTYPTFTYASNTFATILNYPTYTYASSSYATMWNTIAGTNITIDTSTAGTLKITATGGGGGGLGTTSPFTAGKVPIATGTNITLSDSVITQAAGGNVGVGSSTPNAILVVQGAANAPTLDVFQVSSSTGAVILSVTATSTVGINTSSTASALNLAMGADKQHGINFGDATADLYRSAAGTIKTDGTLAFTAATFNGTNWTANASNNLTISGNHQNMSGAESALLTYGQTNVVTTAPSAGVQSSFMDFTGTFGPTSGAGGFNSLQLNNTFNQWQNSVGVTRGLYLNPVLTGVYDFRALETAGYTLTLNTTTPPSNLYGTLLNQFTINTTTTVTVANASQMYIAGAPIASSTNVTISSSTALTIAGGNVLTQGALAANVTNAYGLFLQAPTGATNNYAAVFTGGNVGIGTTVPATTLSVGGDITDGNLLNCDDATHQVGTDGTGKLVCDTALSDARLKKNIQTLNGTESLNELNKIRFVSYNWKEAWRGTALQFGSLAQEVQKVWPNLVRKEKDGLLSMDYRGIFIKMGSALQELSGKVKAILSRLDGQDSKIAVQQKQIDKQEKELKIMQAEIIQLQERK